ncbi:TlpA disulfide reductase family protein [Chitinophaga eiseniae]|uniref:Redoxin domain-containing protein n=1 Tax=Chitinophaga eiseniae TaxID=634771 RepID=A0A847S1J5_9BACT|nr:TlpA disulfide reductase family protein [Chitinophaga eiseniae]NLR77200.1 redoxin domain-containing protein [Chitinophaga eiseniae]
MKKITICALLSWPIFMTAQPVTYVLNGKFTRQNGPAKVYLHKIINEKLVVDSTEAVNGAFHFEGTIDGPVHAMLVVDHHNGCMDANQLPPNADLKIFVLDRGDTRVTATDSINGARISSPIVLELKNYNSYFKAVRKPMERLTKKYNRSGATPAEQAKITQEYQVANEAKKLLQHKYIAENPDSYYSLVALIELAGIQINPDEIEPIFKKLSERIRSTPAGKDFGEEIQRARNLTIGSDAPDFMVPDINGKPVHLSDFKGKVVLLDFWASWCEPCRREHQYIRDAYNAFKDKNFTVISIALDPPVDRKYMLEAIRQDSLTWTNLSDPARDKNDAAKTYSVKALPQNYLIDSTGMIFNKDLHGESIKQQLSSLLQPQNP